LDLVAIDFNDESTWIIVDTSGSILITTNGGGSYDNINSPTNQSIISIKIPEKNGLVFLTAGYKMWKASIYDLIDNIDSFENKNYGFTLFPNPATEKFFVKTENNELKNGIVELYSLRGKLLFQKNIQNNQIEIDCRTLKPGMYLVKLESESTVCFDKVIIR